MIDPEPVRPAIPLYTAVAFVDLMLEYAGFLERDFIDWRHHGFDERVLQQVTQAIQESLPARYGTPEWTRLFAATKRWHTERLQAMEVAWDQANVFPAVARAIEQVHRRSGDYATHWGIAEQLLLDPAGRTLIEAAFQPEVHTAEWLANDMVSWFSERITARETEWSRAFERTQVQGRWAFMPVGSWPGRDAEPGAAADGGGM